MEHPIINQQALATMTQTLTAHVFRDDINESVQRLISLSKQQGFVTVQNINDHIPDSATDPELIENLMSILDSLDIKLLDDDEVATTRKQSDDPMEMVGPRVSYIKTPVFDPFDVYMKQIGKKPVLTREEEVELFKQLRAAEALNQPSEALRFRNELIARNLRLVVSIARHYVARGLPISDLIQVGNFGLIHAIKRFNLSLGNKLSTYANLWIRQSMLRAIDRTGRTVTLPAGMAEKLAKVSKVQQQLAEALDREPTVEEIAEKMGMPAGKVRDVLSIAHESSRVDELGGEDTDVVELLSHLQQAAKSEEGADAVKLRELRERFDMVLRTLTVREMEVVILRFGLLDGVCRTLEEVGQHFALTRERIRQIEKKALRKMRHPSRRRLLQEMSSTEPTSTGPGFDDFTKDAA